VADVVAVGLRGLAYAAALQAAGTPLFLWLFGRFLVSASNKIGAIVLSTATAGLALTAAHAVVEPARLTGELRGIFDGSLLGILLASDFGTTVVIRMLGLAIVVAASIRRNRFSEGTSLIGASLIIVSFAFMGHTAADDQRWLLAPLLIVHLAAAAFWLGALRPLLSTTQLESAAGSGEVIAQFSKVAILLVPAIFLAGVTMAMMLLPGVSSLRTPYGLLLMAKIAGFAVLMGLAAANKWRLGPRVGLGDTVALRAFRISVLLEWFLIVAVVIVTAAMTALFSPEI